MIIQPPYWTVGSISCQKKNYSVDDDYDLDNEDDKGEDDHKKEKNKKRIFLVLLISCIQQFH